MTGPEWVALLDAKPWAAFLLLSLFANLFLFRAYVKAQESRLNDLRALIPLSDRSLQASTRLAELVESVGAVLKRRRPPAAPSPSPVSPDKREG